MKYLFLRKNIFAKRIITCLTYQPETTDNRFIKNTFKSVFRKVDSMTAEDCSHFDQVRQQNRRTVRNLMRGCARIGKAELAAQSGLSFPTISALLNDMLETKEALLLADTASHGGRPAEQFALNPLFQTALCAYIEDHVLHIQIYDVFGSSLHDERQDFSEIQTPEWLCDLIAKAAAPYPGLSVICLGVPGVVQDGRVSYIPDYPDLQDADLKSYMEAKLGVPVYIENDVNVFVLAERDKWPNLIHIFYGANCPGAGILIDGTLLRGAAGGAGELECLPFEHEGETVSFGTKLSLVNRRRLSEVKRLQLLSAVAGALTGAVCFLNPSDAALSGFGLRPEDLSIIQKEIEKFIPHGRCPKLHIVDDVDSLYMKGLLEFAMDYWKAR